HVAVPENLLPAVGFGVVGEGMLRRCPGARIADYPEHQPGDDEPGRDTSTNTQRQEGTTVSSWVTIRGARLRPTRATMFCWMPRFRPWRLGWLASGVATMLVGVKAPAAKPIRARMASRLTRPGARPLRPAIRENIAAAGISTMGCPTRSARRPQNMAEMPQVRARMPEIRPMS